MQVIIGSLGYDRIYYIANIIGNDMVDVSDDRKLDF